MSVNLDWSNLGFEPRHNNGIVVSRYKDGQWSKPELCSDFNLSMDIYAGVLHYSNSCFEGLKAFKGADGKVRIFRPDENAKRLKRSADYLAMASPDEALFVEMCLMCVSANLDYLPPYGHNASMYLRPLLIGVNPQINLIPSSELIFAVIGSPVGSYSGAAALTSVNAMISRDFDRAAPNGSGSYKLSANYAPSFRAYDIIHKAGYKELLFLDPATKTKVDEFGSSNFFGIKNGTFVTPLSNSVLPSITNKSLQTVAADLGYKVEKRVVPYEELAEFEEVGACGTAVVITPIYSIHDKPGLTSTEITREFVYADKGVCGKISAELYKQYRGIQDGLEPDIHSWCVEL